MNRGLTIIEVLIAISVTLILLSVIVFPFKRMSQTQVLSKEVSNVVNIINNARSMSVSSRGGASHGVRFSASEIVLFRGSAYSPTEPGNIYIPLHPEVVISNISLTGSTTETVFDQLTGNATATGTIRIALTASSTQSKTIRINATGIIDEVQ